MKARFQKSLEAGHVRIRSVLMTAIAMIIGMEVSFFMPVN
jgi:multidrug efflux pump subunit AcrB